MVGVRDATDPVSGGNEICGLRQEAVWEQDNAAPCQRPQIRSAGGRVVLAARLGTCICGIPCPLCKYRRTGLVGPCWGLGSAGILNRPSAPSAGVSSSLTGETKVSLSPLPSWLGGWANARSASRLPYRYRTAGPIAGSPNTAQPCPIANGSDAVWSGNLRRNSSIESRSVGMSHQSLTTLHEPEHPLQVDVSRQRSELGASSNPSPQLRRAIRPSRLCGTADGARF